MTDEKEDAAFAIARNVVDTEYEDIPHDAVEVTKKCILDYLGTILAASGISGPSKAVVAIVKEGGGKKESSIMGFGGKVPSWMAAYANGSMAESLDYGDLVDEGRVHCSAPTLPAAFAVAERVRGVSGKEFITAAALGIDLIARMSMAVCQSALGYEDDWSFCTVNGAFSSTAAAGKLLKLNAGQMVNALGIAFNQASGSMEMGFQPDAQVRELYGAFPGMTGVLSALWAQKGISGVKNSLESRAGLYHLHFKGHFNREILLDGLGKRFEVIKTSFKPWPTCRLSQSHIHAAWEIVEEHDVKPGDVAEVIVHVCDSNKTLMEPLEKRRKPDFPIQAKRSIPFTVAVMIARRNILIRDFKPETLKDPLVLGIAGKVKPKYVPSLFTPGIPPAVVDIVTKGGQTFSKRIDHPCGHPESPMSMKKVVEKFEDCASYSAKPLLKANIQRIIELVTGLEKVEDIGEVIKLVS